VWGNGSASDGLISRHRSSSDAVSGSTAPRGRRSGTFPGGGCPPLSGRLCRGGILQVTAGAPGRARGGWPSGSGARLLSESGRSLWSQLLEFWHFSSLLDQGRYSGQSGDWSFNPGSPVLGIQKMESRDTLELPQRGFAPLHTSMERFKPRIPNPQQKVSRVPL